MGIITIKLEFPPQQYEQLDAVAHARKVPVAEVVQAAVVEWLERQARLERARTLMRELGQGLGKGRSFHNVAREHDAHLYPRKHV
jgi:Arc/MetJ-type ribon-helix-helix transcriptional regulator